MRLVSSSHFVEDDRIRGPAPIRPRVVERPGPRDVPRGRGAPADEIRFVEVNDRLAGAESKAEAIDFGLDIEGARFRLFVADVTTDQLERVKQDPSRLPRGWSLTGNQVWRRRGT